MASAATTRMSSFLRQLVRGMAAATFADKSDRQLIELLLAGPDEAAFEALIRRHGPMVYRVCWRVLQQAEDSEDAFQATFLLLARKLSTVKKRDSLASWLHGVAHRVALDSKKQAARRCQREAHASSPEARPPDDPAWRELRDALDTEISNLSEKHRLPLILCYLEGRSQDEAARQLGWSKSTLLRRLAEAREALGRRLKSKGFVVPAALAAILISESVAPAAISSKLVLTTVTAAASSVAGPLASGLVSVKVAALAKGALKTMFAGKLKSFLAVVLLAAGLVTTSWVLSGEGLTSPPVSPAKEAAPDQKSPAGPTKAAAKPVVVRENGHQLGVAWSADGKWLLGVSRASSTTDQTVKVWDATTGEFKKSLTEEKNTQNVAITVSPDKKQVAILCYPSQGRQFVKIFDAESWDLQLKIEFVQTSEAASLDVERKIAKVRIHSVVTLAFSPDGKTLALGGAGYNNEDGDYVGTLVRLWDLQGQKLKDTTSFTTPTRPGKESEWQAQSLAFSPDGKVLASAERGWESRISRIQLYDARTGEPKKGWDIGKSSAKKIAFANDGKNLITASDANVKYAPDEKNLIIAQDAEVKSWDVATGKELQTWDTQGWTLTDSAASPDGRHLAVGVWRNEKDKPVATSKVLLFDAKTGRLKQTIPWLHSLGGGQDLLAFSPDSQKLAICGRPASVELREDKLTGKSSWNAKDGWGEIQIIPLSR